MPRYLACILAVPVLFSACSNPSNSDPKGPDPVYYTVTLQHGGGTTVKVLAGSVVTGPQGFGDLPEDIVWCTNPNGQGDYAVTEDVTLYPLNAGIRAVFNQADLEKIDDSGANLAGTYVLVQDIELSGTWTPIGDNSAPFTGKFIGAGHRIKNLILPPDKDYIGLFGYTSGAAIQDLVIELEGTPITSTSTLAGLHAGAVAGSAENSAFTNIRVEGSLTLNAAYTTVNAGGIAGFAHNSTIENCSATGAVNASSSSHTYAGGIAGFNISSGGSTTIENCSATGDISAYGYVTHAGGIAGFNRSISGSITIENCSATGAVNAAAAAVASAGGIAGYNSSNGGSITIESCYALGAVNAATSSAYSSVHAGGIAGSNGGSITIENCYATGAVNASTFSSTSSSVHAGGIAGYNGGSGSITIENCAALMSGIMASKGYAIHRITAANNGTLANNIALDAMTLAGSTTITAVDDAAGLDGLGKTANDLQTRETYASLGWDFGQDGDWKWDGTNKRPILAWES